MSESRMSLAEAARHYGVAVNTIRSRWKTGKLRGERDEAGRIWVFVPRSGDGTRGARMSAASRKAIAAEIDRRMKAERAEIEQRLAAMQEAVSARLDQIDEEVKRRVQAEAQRLFDALEAAAARYAEKAERHAQDERTPSNAEDFSKEHPPVDSEVRKTLWRFVRRYGPRR